MIWKLTDKLFWGDRDAPYEIKERGIGSLICVAEEVPVPTVDIPYLRVPMPNGHPIPSSVQHFLMSVISQFIVSYSPVMIYCRGGTNRSTGTALLYLIHKLGMSKKDAWNKIKELKPTALDWSKDYTKIVELGE